MQALNNIKIIGIGGLARSGKDTFVAIAKNILKRNGYAPFRIAFADKLKEEVEAMLVANNFKASVLTDDTEAKKLIRPLLVWWGCQRRYESDGGLYWVKKAEEVINHYYSNAIDKNKLVFLVSDVRFPNEVKWVHETFGGEVIHLKKYAVQTVSNRALTEESFIKIYDTPPNEEEKKQDPIVREMSNYQIEWEKSSAKDLMTDPTLNKIVLEALNRTKYFRHPSIGILS